MSGPISDPLCEKTSGKIAVFLQQIGMDNDGNWPGHLPSHLHGSDVQSIFNPVDQLLRLVCRCSPRTKQMIAPEDSVDLDLPIAADETSGVRRHDLDPVPAVGKFAGRGHSAIRVDVEIRRLL
jgi:hypothetical protein